MSAIKFLSAIILFFLIDAPFSYAQQINLNTTSLNSNNGLSQNSIQSILKDSQGFMWFGTQDGLNKYDGFKFTIYKNSKNNPSSIGANLVNSICEDADGSIWAGTRLGGVSRYDRTYDSFRRFKNDDHNPSSLSNDNVQVIYKDKQLNLWVGTENGLNLYNHKSGGSNIIITILLTIKALAILL